MSDNNYIVTEKAMRPATPARECFYCNVPIGGVHKDTCVLRRQNVRVALAIEFEDWMPVSWTPDFYNDTRNLGSNCLDNQVRKVLEEYNARQKRYECSCGIASVRLIEKIGEPFLQED